MSSTETWSNSFVDPIADVTPVLLDDSHDVAMMALEQSRQAVCITDAAIDAPGPRIEYVNAAYLDIFCCEVDDVVGRTPRVGQGPLTDRGVLDRIRDHLEAGDPVRAQAINYRFDRSTFRLRWSIDPVRRGGRVVNFVGLLQDVTTEDRMRRRLTALDTIVTSGRAVTGAHPAERHQIVARALGDSLAPMVAEIGRAIVVIGDHRVAVEGSQLTPVDPTRTRLAIGSLGSVEVETHPDADALVDHLGMREMVAQAEWLLGLATSSTGGT